MACCEKANLDIIASLLNTSLAVIRGVGTQLSQIHFLCYFHDVAQWTQWMENKDPVLFREDVCVGGYMLCQVGTGLVEFRLITICPQSTCLNTHTHTHTLDTHIHMCRGG